MEQMDQIAPSNNLMVNFRTQENSNSTINTLKNIQNLSTINHTSNTSIKYDISTENYSMFISLGTNITKRPIKLLVDTGASVSLVANDIILDNAQKLNFTINLWGITGTGNTVKTDGIICGISKLNQHCISTTLHIIDRKYAGPADGYLGFDFLSQYEAIIDMRQMKLLLNITTPSELKETLKPENDEHNKIKDASDVDNFLVTMGNSLIFGDTNDKITEHRKKEYRDYFKTVHHYEMDDLKRITRKIQEFELNNTNQNEYFNQPMTGETTTMFSIKYKNEISSNTEINTRITSIYNKLSLSHCSNENKIFIHKLCANFPFQFYVEGDNLGKTDVIKHKINIIPGSKIINLRQYRIPHTHKKPLENIIIDYEKQGIIEKCQSNYNSPVILVGKKDRDGKMTDFRCVVDYRKLNEITEMSNFPIPLIDDILDGLSGCTFFTTLDIKGAFHQIELDEPSRNYTAFTAGNFQYRWVRMPMGLSASPLTWQRAINTILANLIGKGAYVYLDDVIIYAKTLEEHNSTLLHIMKLFETHKLQLKIAKCIFYAKRFEYLGHIISQEGIKANPNKIEVIKNYPKPTNVKKIQSFLGLCSYFRRYVRNFAKLAKGLTTLLKKEQPFLWTHIQEKSFNDLKQALIEQVVLSFPNFEQLFYVTTDASDIAIGSILSQGELPNDRPIQFFSRVLNEAQKRYSTIERELLAIVESIKAFRVYLYGRFFILITDHKPLCYLFNMKDCGSRLFRQKLELLDYNFKILYRQGAQNHVADALSRLEPLTIEEMLEANKRTGECFVLTRAQIRKELDDVNESKQFSIDEKPGTILNKRSFDLIFHFVPRENEILKTKIMNKFGLTTFTHNWYKFNNCHYVLLISNQFSHREIAHKTKTNIIKTLQICQEENAENIAVNLDYDNLRHYIFFKNLMRETFINTNISITIFLNKIIELTDQEDIDIILELYHKNLLGGHMGADKMLNTISKFYKWNNMFQNIREFVKKCIICEKTKITTNTKIPMQISSLGDCLFDHTFIDFVGPISPISTDGHRYIFTAICDITKFLIAVPTKDCTALTSAYCLIENIFLRYNFPTRLISDNASNFNSIVIKEISNLFKAKKVFTTPYHAQSNIVERSHRTLNAYLRAFTAKNNDIWHELLKYATFAYNNSIHSTTGYTPHELAHGFRIQIPNNLLKPKLIYNYDCLADNIRNHIAKTLEIAKEHLTKKKNNNKHYYDNKTRELDININDLILLKNQTKINKFQDIYSGPYRVIDTSDSYIQIMKNGKPMKVHKNLIKKAQADYENDNIPSKIPIIELNEDEIEEFI